jgi:hypothetical protein
MSKLRTYAPLSRQQSEKVKQEEAEFKAVYAVVDARSEGRCEYNPMPEYGTTPRCPRRASDHHHLYKPRRSNHEPILILHLCRDHHDRASWPYQRGRLTFSIINGLHKAKIVYASDKWAARALDV